MANRSHLVALEQRGYAKDLNALGNHQAALKITNNLYWLISTYRRETWNFSRPAPAMRYLAAKYQKSRQALYNWRNELVALGYLIVTRRTTKAEGCLSSTLDFSPLWAKLAALCGTEPPLSTDEDSTRSTMVDSPRSTGMTHGKTPEDNVRPEIEETPSPQVLGQWNALGQTIGSQLKVRHADAQHALARTFQHYAHTHALSRREVEKLLGMVLEDRRYRSPDTLLAGLEVYRKAVAA